MPSNWQYLALAFALAVFSWYLVSGRETVDTWIQVPVEMVNMPEGYVVRKGMVSRIDVRIRGPRPMIRTIDMRNAFYPLDLDGLEAGLNQLEFETRNLNLSRAIQVIDIEPSRVDLLVDKVLSKRVPVHKQLVMNLHEDFELRGYDVRPSMVMLRGPQVMVDPMEAVDTQPVMVENPRPEPMELTVGLDLPSEVESDPSRVSLQLDFREKRSEVALQIRVMALQPTGMALSLEPSAIKLTVSAPISVARDPALAEQVRVVAAHLGELPPGEHEVGYRVELPPGVTLMQSEPERIRVTLEPQAADTANSPGESG